MICIEHATPSDKAKLNSMLDDYLSELTRYRDISVGATSSADYRLRNAYLCETGRHALLIHHDGDVAGFALIRTPHSTRSFLHHLAEFYVEPKHRRRGIGRAAAIAIWKRFPGRWELQALKQNDGAVQFWKSCIESVTTDLKAISLQGCDGRRLQFNFTIQVP